MKTLLRVLVVLLVLLTLVACTASGQTVQREKAQQGAGTLAIVNNQIVKVGDTVSGYRVTRITEKSVILAAPAGPPLTIELPEMAPAAAAPPRR